MAVPLWAVLFAAGLAMPNAPGPGAVRYGEAAGTAAALLGAVQFGVGALVSPLVGLLGNDALAMGAVIVASLLLAVAVLLLVVRPWPLAEPQDGPAPAFAPRSAAARSDEQRLGGGPRGQRGHLLVGRPALEALGGVEQPRQDLDVAGGEQERLRPAEHPVHGQVDVGLLAQRLVPGRGGVRRGPPSGAGRGS